MTLRNAHASRRPGFTLIELLTVVAIISLLIGILLPSLSKARDQAKKAKILAMLDSIGKSLEMFNNDFGQYPDSSLRKDSINWDVSGAVVTPNTAFLSGAHWLARALVGHDRQGIDTQQLVMQGWQAGMTQPLESALRTATRKGAYFEGNVYFRDNDPNSGLNTISVSTTSDYKPGGRLIVVDDAFKSPILYYRAAERAPEPFCADGTGSASPINTGNDRMGIYRQSDNAPITGCESQFVTKVGWDFGNSLGGKYTGHQIGKFGDLIPNPATNPNGLGNIPTGYINTFVNYFKNTNAFRSSGAVKPVNPDRFILMSAGKDGVFGTDDDITNFNQ